MSKPDFHDLQSYLSTRERLITEDRALRHDNGLLKSASEEELKAEQIIRSIRSEEAQSVWSKEHEGVPNTFPGMEFLSGE